MSTEHVTLPKTDVVLMMGLPYSGKTTAALELSNGMDTPIVSPDMIRYALHGQRYQPEAEEFVWAIARVMMKSLLYAGHDRVIIDATNTTRARRDEWRTAATELDNWTVGVLYIDTSREVCEQRARARGDKEILPVIARMAEKLEPPQDDELLVGWYSMGD